MTSMLAPSHGVGNMAVRPCWMSSKVSCVWTSSCCGYCKKLGAIRCHCEPRECPSLKISGCFRIFQWWCIFHPTCKHNPNIWLILYCCGSKAPTRCCFTGGFQMLLLLHLTPNSCCCRSTIQVNGLWGINEQPQLEERLRSLWVRAWTENLRRSLVSWKASGCPVFPRCRRCCWNWPKEKKWGKWPADGFYPTERFGQSGFPEIERLHVLGAEAWWIWKENLLDLVRALWIVAFVRLAHSLRVLQMA